MSTPASPNQPISPNPRAAESLTWLPIPPDIHLAPSGDPSFLWQELGPNSIRYGKGPFGIILLDLVEMKRNLLANKGCSIAVLHVAGRTALAGFRRDEATQGPLPRLYPPTTYRVHHGIAVPALEQGHVAFAVANPESGEVASVLMTGLDRRVDELPPALAYIALPRADSPETTV